MRDETYFTPDRQTCSWPVSNGRCFIQTSSIKTAEQIQYWSFASIVGDGWNNPLRIYSVPLKKWRWVLKALGMGLPPKNPTRVHFGHKTGKQHLKKGTETPGHKNLKAIRGTHFKNEPQR
ncbi:MAG: hypothetical protein A2048_00815 [Deltaproteobacteria bacterium GWA2_45_12]|nr:MAG: hypothetical protein A2048_00815 [Deltaproteobacteria bacterium GWA2_45_12]